MKRTLTALLVAAVCIVASPRTVRADQSHQPVRRDAQVITHIAALGLGGILRDIPDRDDRIAMLRKFVAPVRFFPDNSGYFFVYDTKGTCLAHGEQKKIEGRNLLSFKDANGSPVVQLLIEAAQNGGGFVEYSWNKPGVEGFFDKLGYAEMIPGTDFLIGTGIYFKQPW